MALLLQETPPQTISATRITFEEELIRDDRESITATQHIQYKLRQMLPNTSLPVSCMHTCRFVNRYNS